VHQLLYRIADSAGFDVETDAQLSAEMRRKINISLAQVSPERAIDLILGNINRVVTYESTGDDRLQLERIQIVDSASNGPRTFASIDMPVRKQTGKTAGKAIKRKQYNSRLGSKIDLDRLNGFRERLAEKNRAKRDLLKVSEQKLLAHLGNIQKNLIDDYRSTDSDTQNRLELQKTRTEEIKSRFLAAQ